MNNIWMGNIVCVIDALIDLKLSETRRPGEMYLILPAELYRLWKEAHIGHAVAPIHREPPFATYRGCKILVSKEAEIKVIDFNPASL